MPTCTSWPTLASTLIFLSILSACFQAFSEGSSFVDACLPPAAKATEFVKNNKMKNKLTDNFIFIFYEKTKYCGDRQRGQAAKKNIPRPRYRGGEFKVEHQTAADEHAGQRRGLVSPLDKCADKENPEDRTVKQGGNRKGLSGGRAFLLHHDERDSDLDDAEQKRQYMRNAQEMLVVRSLLQGFI